MTQSALDRARGGSEQAFRELIDPCRGELHLHCYRMLGSPVEAEDILQETLLAAWRGLEGFEGRSSIRAWLYRIATNRCLNALRDAGRHAPKEPIPPFDPPPPSRRSAVTWLQPYADTLLERAVEHAPGPAARYLARETVELAFVAALQRLPPRQVAALLLCDVLDFSIAEVARMMDTTAGAVKGALQRARASHAEDQAARGGSHRPTNATQEWDLARRFAQAFTDDDIDSCIELLTDDAWLTMPPAPHEYHGLGAIRAFLSSSATWRAGRRIRLVPTGANSQPAFGCYLADASGAQAWFIGVIVLTVRDSRISGISGFRALSAIRLGTSADSRLAAAMEEPRSLLTRCVGRVLQFGERSRTLGFQSRRQLAGQFPVEARRTVCGMLATAERRPQSSRRPSGLAMSAFWPRRWRFASKPPRSWSGVRGQRPRRSGRRSSIRSKVHQMYRRVPFSRSGWRSARTGSARNSSKAARLGHSTNTRACRGGVSPSSAGCSLCLPSAVTVPP